MFLGIYSIVLLLRQWSMLVFWGSSSNFRWIMAGVKVKYSIYILMHFEYVFWSFILLDIKDIFLYAIWYVLSSLWRALNIICLAENLRVQKKKWRNIFSPLKLYFQVINEWSKKRNVLYPKNLNTYWRPLSKSFGIYPPWC